MSDETVALCRWNEEFAWSDFQTLSVRLTSSSIQLAPWITVRFLPVPAIIFARTLLYETVLSVFQIILPFVFLINCVYCDMLVLFSQELNSLEPHENFRLWLTAESHPKFPTILLQSSLKVTYEVSLIFFELKKLTEKKNWRNWTDANAKWRNTKILKRHWTIFIP